MNVYFRTDGNMKVATGHIMRCLSIARALKKTAQAEKKECEITFLVADEESLSMLTERFLYSEEFDATVLHSSFENLLSEIDTLLTVVQKGSLLFIDSYYANPAYFQALSPYFKIAYLDDLRSFPCDVDLLINYDTKEDCPFYNNARVKLLGMEYTPLREQFMDVPYVVSPDVKNVFFSAGGTDPYGIAYELLYRIFETFPGETSPKKDYNFAMLRTLHYHVLAGKFTTHYEKLSLLSQKYPCIHVHESVTDMASLMKNCDLAISAGGTTLCELCSVGVPTISYFMADNQITAVEAFSREGLIPCAGDIRTSLFGEDSGNDVFDRIFTFLISGVNDYEGRKKSSQSMRALSFGSGAFRIARHLLESM